MLEYLNFYVRRCETLNFSFLFLTVYWAVLRKRKDLVEGNSIEFMFLWGVEVKTCVCVFWGYWMYLSNKCIKFW
jgi:hypothetical protein